MRNIKLNNDEIKIMRLALEEIQRSIKAKCKEHYNRGDKKGEDSLQHLYDYVEKLKEKLL